MAHEESPLLGDVEAQKSAANVNISKILAGLVGM